MTVSQPAGLAISCFTALAVATLGAALLPERRNDPGERVGGTASEVASRLPAPPDPRRPTTADAAPLNMQAVSAGGDADGVSRSDANTHGEAHAQREAAPKDTTPENETASPPPMRAEVDDKPSAQPTAAGEQATECKTDDKDLARQAWHHNTPSVCQHTSGAVMVLPFKGRPGSARPEYRRRLREARVVIPRSEPLLTHRQYNVQRLGFDDVYVVKLDNGGLRFRVRLQPGTSDPVVDVREGYVKLTVKPGGKG